MVHDVNIRALVLETLTEIDRNGKNSSELMQSTLRNYQYLDKKDRAFYSRLCQGTLEYRIQLDYLIDQVSKTPVNKCKPYIRNLLRMSLYQIRYMDRVADQVVCNEAVKLAKKKGFGNLSGFVNGVLRNLIRQQDSLTLPRCPVESKGSALNQYLSVMYSIPEYMVELFLRWYPAEIAEKMFRSFLQEHPVSIRVDRNQISANKLIEMIQEAGITVIPGSYSDSILRITDYNYIKRVPGYREGLFTVQDESSCLQGYLIPAHELTVPHTRPARILDLCASPGGKVIHAAERIEYTQNHSKTDNRDGADSRKIEITARDLTESKLERIRENLERVGRSEIYTEVYDATEYDPSLEQKMDLVIADLPCSGLGVMGRKKDIKYHLTPEQFEELIELQRSILRNAVRYLVPGGYLIYSTCTLNPGENEVQVSWMKEQFALETVSLREDLPETLIKEVDNQPHTDLDRGYCTLLPGLQSCDGFFMAKLRRI